MKDLLTLFTFALGILLSVAFLSTLKPVAVDATVGGAERTDRCTLTASLPPACHSDGFAALSWSVAAMVTNVAKDRSPSSH